MTLNTSLQQLLILENVSLADVEAIRLILRGLSVIDWYKLDFHTHQEAEDFLRVNRYEINNDKDNERLRYLLTSSREYLERNFFYHFPKELCEPPQVTDVFLIASGNSDLQSLACILLKVAHVINHIEARELRYRLQASDDLLFKRAEEAVDAVVKELIDAGAPIISYQQSRKSRDSLITKLLAKKDTVAAQIFDRLRFRIITKTALDLIPVLVHLKNRLFPFNYVVPGQSHNDILSISDVIEAVPSLRPLAHQLQYPFQLEEAVAEEENLFSASSYKMINFVVDMPMRVDDLIAESNDPELYKLGFLVFILVEFQMFDEATWQANESGDASHEKYKQRQRWDVIRRLVYGGGIGPGHGKERF